MTKETIMTTSHVTSPDDILRENVQKVLMVDCPTKRTFSGTLLSAVITSILAVTVLAAPASAKDTKNPDRLLSVDFQPRQVVKIESGDFHFKPGQIGPIHNHPASTIGYVTKGAILYQVEGRDLQLLNTGDAFYEPSGPRIMRFDNASPTEEAIFIDFNLLQNGEAFIAFEKPPTENIDRRPLLTKKFSAQNIDGADIYRHTIQPDGKQYLEFTQPIAGYVAEGVVELRVNGKRLQSLKAGENFYQIEGGSGGVLVNTSSDISAKVVVFNLNTP